MQIRYLIRDRDRNSRRTKTQPSTSLRKRQRTGPDLPPNETHNEHAKRVGTTAIRETQMKTAHAAAEGGRGAWSVAGTAAEGGGRPQT